MIKLFALAFYLIAPPQSDQVTGEADLVRQSENQARHYISNITEGNHLAESYWALSALVTGKIELKKYVSTYLEDNGISHSLLSDFQDTTYTYGGLIRDGAISLEDPELLLGYLLHEKDSLNRQEALEGFPFGETNSNIRYRVLLQSLVLGESIDKTVLPLDNVGFTHFLLLYHAEGRQMLPASYLDEIAALPVRNNGPEPDLPSILKWMSSFQAQYYTNNYSQALDYYSLLSNDELMPNSKYKFSIYRYLDYSMYQLGYTDRSLEIVRNFTLPLSHYLNQQELQLSLNLARAFYLNDIGKIKDAQTVYHEVLAEAERRNLLEQYLSVLFNNLAVTYNQMGNYDQYFNLQFRALEIADSASDYNNQFTILQNLFVTYRNNRNAESALLYLNRARELARGEGEADDIATIDLLAGTFYENIEQDYPRAEEFFARAEEQSSPEENYSLYQELKFEQADLYSKTERYEEALDTYHHIAELAKANNSPENVIESRIKMAGIHLQNGNFEAAREAIDFYTGRDLSPLRFDQLVEAKTVEADYLIRTDSREKAYEILEPLIGQVVEWVRGSTDLQTGFWNVETEFLEAFKLTGDFLIESGRPAEAVEVLDRLKSINDANLYQNPLVRSSILSESELSQFKRLTDRLDQLRRSLLNSTGSRREQLQQQIDELSAQKRVFDRKLSDLTSRPPVSVDYVQSRLDARERVLHITELEDQYYVASISRTSITFRTVELDSLARSLFETSVSQIANKETDLQNLYRISRLMGFDEMDSSVERLTVIPDSYLYQLPLDILPVTEPDYSYSYGGSSYLIEEVEVRYLTSLNDFRTPERSGTTHRRGYAGYGISTFEHYGQQGLVPLPYARREVENIRNTLTNLEGRDTYFDSASTEEVFKSTAPSARILHLATHSQVSDQDPLFSRIFMSRTGNEEEEAQFPGQIFAYELFELNLNSDLIMLNSCESGSGGYLQGSGVMGISRALRYAGARTLVLNLWSVNDMMASDFALKFYEGLNSGMSKPEALRSAKLHFLKNKNANPHFWGPYMLIGDDEPAVKPRETWNYVVAGSFMLYFLIFVGGSLFFRSRRRSA